MRRAWVYGGPMLVLRFPARARKPIFGDWLYRISGNFGAMEILASLADEKNTPN